MTRSPDLQEARELIELVAHNDMGGRNEYGYYIGWQGKSKEWGIEQIRKARSWLSRHSVTDSAPVEEKRAMLLEEVLIRADDLLAVMDEHSEASAKAGSYRDDASVVHRARKLFNAVQTVKNYRAPAPQQQVDSAGTEPK